MIPVLSSMNQYYEPLALLDESDWRTIRIYVKSATANDSHSMNHAPPAIMNIQYCSYFNFTRAFEREENFTT